MIIARKYNSSRKQLSWKICARLTAEIEFNFIAYFLDGESP